MAVLYGRRWAVRSLAVHFAKVYLHAAGSLVSLVISGNCLIFVGCDAWCLALRGRTVEDQDSDKSQKDNNCENGLDKHVAKGGERITTQCVPTRSSSHYTPTGVPKQRPIWRMSRVAMTVTAFARRFFCCHQL